MYYMSVLRLAVEGDTADRKPEVPVTVAQEIDSIRVEVQVVGTVIKITNRRPISTLVARIFQTVA